MSESVDALAEAQTSSKRLYEARWAVIARKRIAELWLEEFTMVKDAFGSFKVSCVLMSCALQRLDWAMSI